VKLVPAAEWLQTPFALHIANKSVILTVVEVGVTKIPSGGYPAVLADGVHWFAAELIEDPKEALFVAAAVDMCGDRETARRNLRRRDWREDEE
jgi:hypothetical protein